MSGEEDVELRDLVTQTLEANGILGKLKAQLRASVFLALDEQDPLKHKAPFRNKDFQRFASSREGHEVLYLIREFLQCFNLEYSLAVFDAETDYSSESTVRTGLLKQLGVTETSDTSKVPLICKILQQVKKGQHENQDIMSQNTSEVEKRNTENRTSVLLGTDLKNTLSQEDSTDDDSFFIGSNSAKDKKSKSDEKNEISLPDQVLKHTATSKADRNDQFDTNKENKNKNGTKDDDSETQDDDYEADFQFSNVTPIGQTPRSARSDARTIETEEISEEIEDLTKSDASQLEDMTTDRTVSPDLEKTGKADYLEDIFS